MLLSLSHILQIALFIILIFIFPAFSKEEIPFCAGDCNSDGRVTAAEILAGAHIWRGISPKMACTSFDLDSNGEVSVQEFMYALRNAFTVCKSAPEEPFEADDFDSLISNDVTFLQHRDFADAERNMIHEEIVSRYPTVALVFGASVSYNAFGRVFGDRKIWMEKSEAQAIVEHEYILTEDPARVGDLVLFSSKSDEIASVGTVVKVDVNGAVVEVQSKWGSAGEYRHSLKDFPPSYGGPLMVRKRVQDPLCDKKIFSMSDVETAVAAMMDPSENSWDDPHTFFPFMKRIETDLHCRFLADSGGISAIFHSDGEDYDPSVYYCGPADSSTTILPNFAVTSQCLNKKCYDHDRCYHSLCIKGECNWGPQTGTCDAGFLAACNGGCLWSLLNGWEQIICSLARCMKNTKPSIVFSLGFCRMYRIFQPASCFERPCFPGFCDSRSGVCADPTHPPPSGTPGAFSVDASKGHWVPMGKEHRHTGAKAWYDGGMLKEFEWSWRGCPTTCPPLSNNSGFMYASSGNIDGPSYTPTKSGLYNLLLRVWDVNGYSKDAYVTENTDFIIER